MVSVCAPFDKIFISVSFILVEVLEWIANVLSFLFANRHEKEN